MTDYFFYKRLPVWHRILRRRTVYVDQSIADEHQPSRHETLTSSTSTQHQNNIWSMSRVCLEVYVVIHSAYQKNSPSQKKLQAAPEQRHFSTFVSRARTYEQKKPDCCLATFRTCREHGNPSRSILNRQPTGRCCDKFIYLCSNYKFYIC